MTTAAALQCVAAAFIWQGTARARTLVLSGALVAVRTATSQPASKQSIFLLKFLPSHKAPH